MSVTLCPSGFKRIDEIYIDRAIQCAGLTGLAAGNVITYFNDFAWDAAPLTTDKEWKLTVAGAGSAYIQYTSYLGGWGELVTGSGSSSTAKIAGPQTGLYSAATPAWYYATRMALSTGMNANAYAACGLDNGTKAITLGWHLAGHATNFTLSYDSALGSAGSYIDYGVGQNTSTHIFEMWCTSGSSVINTRMDGGAVLTATMSSPPATGCNLVFMVANGATATLRALDFDWVFYASQRT